MSVLVGISARSIQSYVFGSNALRDVVGASGLVEELLAPDQILNHFGAVNAQVLATGGGVTVLRVNDEELARSGIERLSRHRLLDAPGLNISFTIQPRTAGDLAGDLQRLHRQLADRSSGDFSDALLGTPAGVASCRTTGGPAALMDKRFRSPLSYQSQRARSAGLAQTAWVSGTLPPDHGNKSYRFPTDLDDLGRTVGERSLLGIVHLDGTGIGAKAQHWAARMKDAPEPQVESEYRSWSDGLRNCVSNAWAAVEEATKDSLEPPDGKSSTTMVGQIDSLNFEVSIDSNDVVGLPVRKIVQGGDDLTFIAEGRIALALAAAAARAYQDTLDGLGEVHASVGVALVRAHSPFMPAYQLADQLCANAKRGRNGEPNAGPHIDWHLGLLEPGQSLHEARAALGASHTMRPYPLAGSPGTMTWDELEQQVLGIGKDGLRSERWQRVGAKVRSIPSIIRREKTEQAAQGELLQQALQEWRIVDPELALPEPVQANGYLGDSTPLIDAVELLERHQVPKALTTSPQSTPTGAPA